MKLLSCCGLELRVASGVVIAAAALPVIAMMGTLSSGNSDAPRVVLLASFFWCSGWIAQTASYLVASRLVGTPCRSVTWGVFGVEVGPRRWLPQHALLVVTATLASLFLLGLLYQLIHESGNPAQTIRRASPPWIAPSLGLSEHDSLWQSAAWLCWAQALLQLYPFPRALGRHLVGSLTAIYTRRQDTGRQRLVFRRTLDAVALLTMGITLWSIVAKRELFGMHWLFLLGISLILWVSARGSDLLRILEGYRSVTDFATPQPDHQRQVLSTSLLSPIRRKLRQSMTRRKIKKARQQEVEEAVDAGRLDEILSRLHQQGVNSLSAEDRRVLDRVSANLRRQREENPDRRSSSD